MSGRTFADIESTSQDSFGIEKMSHIGEDPDDTPVVEQCQAFCFGLVANNYFDAQPAIVKTPRSSIELEGPDAFLAALSVMSTTG